MNKEILNIELGLGNCEVHTYDGEYIDKLIVGEIRTELLEYDEDRVFSMKRVDEFYLKVSPEANTLESLDVNFRDSNQRPFTRITKHDDIGVELSIIRMEVQTNSTLNGMKQKIIMTITLSKSH